MSDLNKEDLVRVRESLGMEQDEFANALEYSTSYIQKLETQDKLYSPKVVGKLQRKIARIMQAKEQGTLTTLRSPAEGGRSFEPGYYPQALFTLLPLVQGLDQDKLYNLFPVVGNSMMHTINQGDFLLCEKVDYKNMINGRVYVLVITNEKMREYRHSGVWVKRCYLRLNRGEISCKSDNNDTAEPYMTFPLKINELAECWYPVLKITGHLMDPNRDIYNRLDEIENRLEILESNTE